MPKADCSSFYKYKMNTQNISRLSKLLALISALCLLISLFVPLWQIDLDAPQYPEGLGLLIYPHKIGGDVDIINGLNHYIGMQTLHTENFIEFKLLPYIISFFALFCLSIAIVNRKKMLYTVFISFVLFGIISMVDFYRWEYNYGHNLDPNAAIIVPGMAYQPPLIGFKQLLNFGAYSIPATGGWLFIVSGILLLTAVLFETGFLNRFKKTKANLSLLLLGLTLASCGNKGPEAIALNKDKCDFCKMTIADGRFAAELLTEKGRIYKFDDVSCLSAYSLENTNPKVAKNWVSDYENLGKLIEAESAFYIQSEQIKSPMGGNTAAFENKDKALNLASGFQTHVLNWDQIQNKN